MNGPYNTATVTYEWTCSACAAKDQQTWQVAKRAEIPTPPTVPDGWRIVDLQAYCPKHNVLVLISDLVYTYATES